MTDLQQKLNLQLANEEYQYRIPRILRYLLSVLEDVEHDMIISVPHPRFESCDCPAIEVAATQMP